MTAQPHEPLTQAEFPAWESRQLNKHEFVDGHVYGFAGGTIERNTIAVVLIEKIAPAARPCRTYGSDMLIEMTSSTRYADLVVTCDGRDSTPGSRVIHYPKLVIEVLSESTAKDDLGPKLREYQGIATLEEYVTIDSRKRWAQVARREASRWILELPVTTGSLEVQSIGAAVDLDDLYDDAGVPT